MRPRPGHSSLPPQFEQFRATELYCPRCRTAQPVRERLLLALPRSDLLEYRCTVCGTSCGTREAPHPPPGSPRAAG
ncbi:MAG: hypothetical protein N2652_12650 [Kiritimatiellae bacterium]|nr:hypothetical protein [Kiritimatiellia bacterium]